VSELVAAAVVDWRGTLVAQSGSSSLSDITMLGEASLDFSAAHPSGVAQLFAGRPTRLSNLVREGAALSTARRRARAVSQRADDYSQRFGVAPTFLAIGVATWTERVRDEPASADDDVAALATVTRVPDGEHHGSDGAAGPDTNTAPTTRTRRAPVLLRPVTLQPRGSGGADYELVLTPTLEVNPVLARALRAHGGLVDPVSLARGAFTGTGFDPRPALDRLAQLGRAVLTDFELTDSLVLGVFGHPAQVLVEDLDELASGLARHEVVAALADDPRSRSALALPMPEAFVGDRDPGDERGVGDLDPAQQHALDVVATGAHLFLDAPPGADTTTTVAALVADAAASGRTVLYVPGHRRAAVALAERLTALGLDDLLLDVAPVAGWRTDVCRRLLGAMTLEQRPLDVTSITRRREHLVARREQLRGYVDALHIPREPWGCSAYDALQGLARLTAPRPAPQTTVRLGADVARALAGDRRSQVAGELVRAAELGAFEIQPNSTPWYGADLSSDEAAADVVARLERLVESGLPAWQQRAAEVAAQTGLTPAATIDAWGEQLEMLAGVRASLDTFQPIVFERSAADLVAATATKEWREAHDVQLSSGHRRRLRKQAKDMVRPGRPVADLHAALAQIHRQREVWQAHCPAGGWPRLPEGLAEIEAEYTAVRADLDVLERVLATTPAGGGLAALPAEQLAERLRRLLAGRSALNVLPERTRLVRSLLDVGLGELLTDLAKRRVPAPLVAAELDLAWWTGVFEEIMRAEPSLAGFDGARLTELAAQYRELDLEHVAHLPEPVRAAVVGQIQGVLRTHREQAEVLFAELVEEHMVSLRDTVERFGDVARHLRPVIAAAPMLVPHLVPAARTVDLLVVDAADHLALEVALPAIGRARQVVVVGDAKSASGSAVRALAGVLPHVPLRVGDTRRDPHLTAFLAAHGYEGVLEPVPLPRAEPIVGFDVVDGTGMPDADTGAVASTRAEVDQVVELALTHAVTRPDESLAVVTVSTVHADRVRDALLAEVRDNPALAAFFDTGHPEPFVVTDLHGVAGLRRDSVILSVGYGRTPHGRVLHALAPLTTAGGDALLLSALAATRHRLDVVAAFRGSDLDPDRLRGPGSRLLADLLVFAEERAAGGSIQADPQFEVGDDVVDRLVLDLAERLWRAGLLVEVGHGLPGGLRIPLVVGHRDLPDRFLVAVLTDDGDYMGEPSVRVRDRQVAGRLERLGWVVSRVWSAAAFLDPQTEAESIARLVHETADRVLAAEPRRATAGTPPRVETDGDVDAESPTSADPDAAGGYSAPDGPTADAGALDARSPVTKAPSTASVPVAFQADGPEVVPPAFDDIVAGTVVVGSGREPVVATPAAPTMFSPVSSVSSESPVSLVSPVSPESSTASAPTTPSPAPIAEQPMLDVAMPSIDGTPGSTASTASVTPTGSASSTGTVASTGSAAPTGGAVSTSSPTSLPSAGSASSSPAASSPAPRSPRTSPRPPLARGLPIAAYGDDELDLLAHWIVSDGAARDEESLEADLRAELGITKRGKRVDAVLSAVARRALT